MKNRRLLLPVVLFLILFSVSCQNAPPAPPEEAPSAVSEESTTDAANTSSDTADTTQPAEDDGIFRVGVFYYSFGDAYIASMRPTLEDALDKAGISYQIFDGNNNQVTQNEQIATAVAAGYDLLIVNLVTSGHAEVAEEVIGISRGLPVIFFNRAIEPDGEEGVLLLSHDNICFIGTDPPEAGHLQGQMIGEYLIAHYDAVDLNDDGVISYAMFKGEDDNVEAIYRTRYAVEDANQLLLQAGKKELSYFDPSNPDRYQVDLRGSWSEQAAYDYMMANLETYRVADNNMIELVICNNDDMAKGAIMALSTAGFNTGSDTDPVIPVFGVDSTRTAHALIKGGVMTGTVKQDAEGMAHCVVAVTSHLMDGQTIPDAIRLAAEADEGFSVAGDIRTKLLIDYAPYTGE